MTDPKQLVEKMNYRFQWGLQLSEDGQAIMADREKLIVLLSALKDEFGFSMLLDMTAVDYEQYFEVVYHLLNIKDGSIVRIKASVPQDEPRIDSATGLWKAADVQEREIFDLMGIEFTGHDNLQRILCPDDFDGHPLRKSFKLAINSRF